MTAAALGFLGATCSSVRSGPTIATTPRAVPTPGPTVLPVATPSPASGTLLIVLDDNLASLDLATLRAQPLTHFPAGAYAASPCLSPDRKRVVFTYFVPAKDRTDLGGADLYISDADGAHPRLLRAHPASGASFESPCWTADGQAILATARTPHYDAGQARADTVEIVRVGLDGSGPSPVVANAVGPGTSPDGRYLAYSSVDPQGNLVGLMVADASGQNPRPLVTSQDFYAWRSPTFAPDSQTLAFAATGGPNAPLPSIKVGWTPPGTGIAEAHAAYWEIWTVRPDGAERQQLTHESEDSPIPTWSPDGKWIAVAGEMSTYLVDPARARTIVLTSFTTPGIAWLST